MIKLDALIQPDCIRHPLNADDPRGVIMELVQMLRDQSLVADVDEIADAVWAREQQRSTGIGEGLAIPHGRCDSLRKVVAAVGWTDTPIDFQAADGKPVRLIVLIVSPTDDTTHHVQALGAISRTLGHATIRQAAMESTSAETLHAILCGTG
jgi:mannitol/fructose-specific phosphotransferase system IIA component (Ntr-type)